MLRGSVGQLTDPGLQESSKYRKHRPTLWNREIFNTVPAVDYQAVREDDEHYMTFLRSLRDYGFVIVRGFARALSGEGLFCLIATASLVMQFGVQASIHMASSVNLIPTKGMTLPFVSYGGSSLLASSITMGVILALTRKRSTRDHFSDGSRA